LDAANQQRADERSELEKQLAARGIDLTSAQREAEMLKLTRPNEQRLMKQIEQLRYLL
jgi:type II secretory pathway component PulF